MTTSSAGDDAERMVEFRGRQIDLEPYIEGFPYSGFTPYYDANKLFYYHIGETTELRALDLDGDVDLRNGTIISDIDFSTRNVWGIRYRKVDGNLYWMGDERNDEVINLYRLDPNSQAIAKLTDVPYIFGWRWNDTIDRIAYVARLGDKENRLGEIRVLDLASGKEDIIMQDVPEMRFTWTGPSWRPNGAGVVVTVLRDADRTYGNLAYVDFEKKEWKLLTDKSKPRYFPRPYKKWLNEDEVLYFSNEAGFRNLYACNVETGETRQITSFERDIRDADMVTIDGKTLHVYNPQQPRRKRGAVDRPEHRRVRVQ